MQFDDLPSINKSEAVPPTIHTGQEPGAIFEHVTPEQIRAKIDNSKDGIHSIIRSAAASVINSFTLKGRDMSILDDLAQKVSLKVWQKADTFDSRSKLSTWIYTIARNTFISDYVRVKSGKNIVSVEDLPRNDSGEKITLENIVLPKNTEENFILNLDLRKEMSNLPPDVREIIPMLIEGHSHEEIAKKIGIGVGALKSRLHRFRIAIKDKYKV